MKFIILLLLLSLSLVAVKAYDEESIDEEIYDQQEELYQQPPPQQQHQQQQVRLTPEMLTALLVCNVSFFFNLFIHLLGFKGGNDTRLSIPFRNSRRDKFWQHS